MLTALLTMALAAVSTPPGADDGLPCAVHREFLSALTVHGHATDQRPVARFEKKGATWLFTLTLSGTQLLRREFQGYSCTDAAQAGALVVTRYYDDLQFERSAGALKTRPPPGERTPVATPEIPPPALRVLEPEPPDAGTPIPTEPTLNFLDAGTAIPELPVDAGAWLPIEPPDAAIEIPQPIDAGSSDLRAVITSPDAGAPGESAPWAPSLSASIFVDGWWPVGQTPEPAASLDVALLVRSHWRATLGARAGLPHTETITIDSIDRGFFTWETFAASASGGYCAPLNRFTLCGDALFSLRLTRASAAGALYQRRTGWLTLPALGARGELSLPLVGGLRAGLQLSALVPLGQSSLAVEGSSSRYVSPPIDLLAGLGLRYVFF